MNGGFLGMRGGLSLEYTRVKASAISSSGHGPSDARDISDTSLWKSVLADFRVIIGAGNEAVLALQDNVQDQR